MKVIFPWFPKELNPNSTCYFRKKATIKAKYREECARITREGISNAKRDYAELHFTFHKPDKRHRDADNMLAAMKSGIDGMCDALQINDKQFKRIVIDVAENIGGYVVVELK